MKVESINGIYKTKLSNGEVVSVDLETTISQVEDLDNRLSAIKDSKEIIVRDTDPSPKDVDYKVGQEWINAGDGKIFIFDGIRENGLGEWVVVDNDELIQYDDKFVYGVVIDEDNANPETRVQYIEDSVGFKPVHGNNGNVDYGSWKETPIWDAFKPCVLNSDRTVNYYLDKDDLTKKEDGSPAKLDGTDGNVMIEIDKLWLQMYKSGSNQYIKITNKKTDGYQCLAHTSGDKEVDKIYVGRYLGTEKNGKLCSISGVDSTGEKTIGSFRAIAEANGDSYHQLPFYPLQLLQAIMTIMLCNTDTQTALGRGYVDGNSGYIKNGETDIKSFCFGETTGKLAMQFMGLEHFWGNRRQWIDGCKYDGGSIKTATTKFNDNATGYDDVGKYSTGSGYIVDIKGGNKTGFIPDKRDGSDSTHYCDYSDVYDGRFPDFGGGRSSRSYAGGFYLLSSPASFSIANFGARLFAYGK